MKWLGPRVYFGHPRTVIKVILSCTCTVFNPSALRKAKIAYKFGLSECNSVKVNGYTFKGSNSSIFS